MLGTIIRHSVKTYHESIIGYPVKTGGHKEPYIPLDIRPQDNGVQLSVGLTELHNFRKDRTPDIFLERRENGWCLLVAPNGSDAAIAIHIEDDGGLRVVDTHQQQVVIER
jgi:hypothetical protein